MHSKKFYTAVTTALAIVAAILLVTAAPAAAQQETLLYSFSGTGYDLPVAGLIFDGTGNLYGTTPYGGAYSLGAVYELSPQPGGSWTEEILHSFDYGTTNSNNILSNLIFDGAGNLYGTAYQGGTYDCGLAFELRQKPAGVWTWEVLHNFNDNGRDGCLPYAGLVLDASGTLYGTTQTGGAHGKGTVFKLSPQAGGGWAEKVVHSFGFGIDGQYPQASLIFDGAGNLYGTTYDGGRGPHGQGTVFELSPVAGGGWTETILYDFTPGQGVDGSGPAGSLVFDTSGNLYGTTLSGGAYARGEVFELTPATGGGWTETILHSFSVGSGDGWNPRANLILDGAGNLYGTTYQGGTGTNPDGTVFELSPAGGGGWTETILYTFTSGADGENPNCGLIFDSSGNLYGTTVVGGSGGGGTAFEVTP